jgi:hypothetical protein
MQIVGILKSELNKNAAPCGLVDVLMKHDDKYIYDYQVQDYTEEQVKEMFYLLESPILIGAEDYKMFYFVKDDRTKIVIEPLIREKIEIKEEPDFYFAPYSKSTFNQVVIGHYIKNIRVLCNQYLDDFDELIFYNKFFFFFTCQQDNINILHEALFYFCKAFLLIKWTREQIVNWLEYAKKDIPEINIDFVLSRVYKEDGK